VRAATAAPVHGINRRPHGPNDHRFRISPLSSIPITDYYGWTIPKGLPAHCVALARESVSRQVELFKTRSASTAFIRDAVHKESASSAARQTRHIRTGASGCSDWRGGGVHQPSSAEGSVTPSRARSPGRGSAGVTGRHPDRYRRKTPPPRNLMLKSLRPRHVQRPCAGLRDEDGLNSMSVSDM